jgi:hypothetical protein
MPLRIMIVLLQEKPEYPKYLHPVNQTELPRTSCGDTFYIVLHIDFLFIHSFIPWPLYPGNKKNVFNDGPADRTSIKKDDGEAVMHNHTTRKERRSSVHFTTAY